MSWLSHFSIPELLGGSLLRLAYLALSWLALCFWLLSVCLAVMTRSRGSETLNRLRETRLSMSDSMPSPYELRPSMNAASAKMKLWATRSLTHVSSWLGILGRRGWIALAFLNAAC